MGFLLRNTPPARIFMGDVGSTLLGYTLAALPVLAFRQTGDARLFLVGILCVAPFVCDSGVTLLRRAFQREKILQAHRAHLYQRLVRRGHSHAQVSLLYTALALVCALLGLAFLRR